MANSAFFCVPLEKIQVAADQTILTYASVLPNAMAHVKPYGPHCSGNMSKMADGLELRVPLRSQSINICVPPKNCFYGSF